MKQESKKKNSFELGRKVKSLDIFGEGVGFNIGGGQNSHKTYLGSLLTLVIIVICGTYAFKRYTVLKKYSDTTYQTSSGIEAVTKDSPWQ